MDLLTRKILGWMAVIGGGATATVCLLTFDLIRPGGVVCGLMTAGLAIFCYGWPKRYLGRPEVGITWAVGIVGGLATLLYSFLHPIAASAIFANVAIIVGVIGFFSIHWIKPGEMYAVLLLSRWLHTRVNGNDEALTQMDFEILDNKGTPVKTADDKVMTRRVARLGHLGWDFIFAVPPWFARKWSARELVLDFSGLEILTKGPRIARMFVDIVMTVRWSPYLGPAISRLQEKFKRTLPDGTQKDFDRAEPGNEDDSLRWYFQPIVHGVVLKVVQGRTLEELLDPANLEAINTETGKLLWKTVLGHIGLVSQNGEAGSAAQIFRMEIERFFPAQGTELAKNIDAAAVAEERKKARTTEGQGEANYETNVGTAKANVEALKVEKVGVAAATAARARIDAETAGIEEQMKKLGRRKGLTPAAVLDAMTTRSAAQAGGTMIMVPGLAGAAAAVAEVVKGKTK